MFHISRLLMLALACLSTLCSLACAAAEGTVRVLLIGNMNYVNFPDATLKLAGNDATEIAKAIMELDTKASTVKRVDLGVDDMLGAVETHLASLKPDDTSIIYFSGHGLEENGESYLLPVDFPAQRKSSEDLQRKAIRLSGLLDKFA